MPEPVFGRYGDLWGDQVLRDWQDSGNEALRAMAVNTRYDGRVTPAREAAFRAFAPQVSDKTLRNAFKDYFEARVRHERNPDFLEPLNQENIATLYRRPVSLARVVILNGLVPVYQAARQTNEVFRRFPTRPTEETVGDWLDNELRDRPEATRRSFVEATLQEMGRARLRQPFQPAWATLWDHFLLYASLTPEHWLEALGITWEARDPGNPEPLWVVVLKYSVGEAGTLVRPTQLDAGWNAAHFPTPKELPAKNGERPMELPADRGGHPVDYGPDVPGDFIPAEFIHAEITHSPDHFHRIGRIEDAQPGGLATRRRVHHLRLRKFYVKEFDMFDWMPSHCTE